ncbi:MAG: sialidase family protein [Actinomycetaceae bacterium]|nr:sialidase family protein [Actinomycetaceae bacterium]
MFDLINIARDRVDGYEAFRTPALIRTAAGRLLCAYEAYDNVDDAVCPPTIRGRGCDAILLRGSDDLGNTWSDAVSIDISAHSDTLRYGSPSFIYDQVTGRIFLMTALFTEVGFRESAASTDVGQPDVLHLAVSTSDDEGLTWRSSVITAQVTGGRGWRARVAAPGHGIQLSRGMFSGRLIQPAVILDAEGRSRFTAICSDDHGTTWWAGDPVGDNAVSCGIVELSDGRLLLRGLSRLGDSTAMVAYSRDGGRTWEDPIVRESSIWEIESDAVEPAFPAAPDGTPQAQIMIRPRMVQYPDRTRAGFLSVSLDNQQHFGAELLVSEVSTLWPDLASIPEYRVLTRVFQGPKGIEFQRVPFAALGIDEYALGWLNSREVQDTWLQENGLVQVPKVSTETVARR